jgi:hypothetical protein
MGKAELLSVIMKAVPASEEKCKLQALCLPASAYSDVRARMGWHSKKLGSLSEIEELRIWDHVRKPFL